MNYSNFTSQPLHYDDQESEIPLEIRLKKQHNYFDFANISPSQVVSAFVQETETQGYNKRKGPRGGVTVPFPCKLQMMLNGVESSGLSHIVSWQPHGRCFVVHKPKEFVERVMPHYFNQTKMTSFQRQLNLYGFNRLTVGRDRGGYYHSMFLRGREFLAKCILRTRVKGTGGVKAQPNPETEPNFYVMPYVFKNVSSEEAYPATAAISRVLENDCLNSLAHAVPTTSIKPPARTSPDRDSLSSADTLMEMSKIFDECGFNASSDGDQSPGKEDIIKRCLGDLSSFASDSLPIMKASFGGTEPSKAYEMGENLEPTPITSMSEDMPRVPSGFVRFMRHPSQSSLIIAFGD